MRNLTKRDYFNENELNLLKQCLKNDRNSLLIKLALVTGARESELIKLSKDSLNPTNNTIYIEATKGSNDREIAISHELMVDLMNLPTHMLFDINTSRIRQIWYKLRPLSIKKRFHCFRHTFGVELYKINKDIMFVKDAMGHKSINNTMAYVRCVDFETKMSDSHKHLAKLIG
ncbi:MAG: tyrosine-type recombinase/integrase [Pseudobdellovibrio sp.]